MKICDLLSTHPPEACQNTAGSADMSSPSAESSRNSWGTPSQACSEVQSEKAFSVPESKNEEAFLDGCASVSFR